MKFLKSIFFKKYQPTTVYTYPYWENVSQKVRNTTFSMFLKESVAEQINGVVVLAHPMKTEGKQFFVRQGHADFYLKNGFHVIIFDFNGFGESENRGFDFDVDVHTALSFAKNRYPNLKIGLHGVSFGGSQIILGTLIDQTLVDAMIIESAVTSNLDYYKHRNYTKKYKLLNIYNQLFPKRNAKNIYTKSIKGLEKMPLLFIYGTKDVITPYWMGEKLYKNANEPKTLTTFNTEHLTTIEEEPEKYSQEILSFLGRMREGWE